MATNDSKATVSVLYWYRNYPSLEHQLSYFWILLPALELGQTFELPTFSQIDVPSVIGLHWNDEGLMV